MSDVQPQAPEAQNAPAEQEAPAPAETQPAPVEPPAPAVQEESPVPPAEEQPQAPEAPKVEPQEVEGSLGEDDLHMFVAHGDEVKAYLKSDPNIAGYGPTIDDALIALQKNFA